MYYATSTFKADGPIELHVFKSKRDRDRYVTERLFQLGDVSGRRDATTAEAKSCEPWSMVLHDLTLANLSSLPSWAYTLVAKATNWFAKGGDTHLCLV